MCDITDLNFKGTTVSDLSWDQRIPNEMYCQYPYLLNQPPILTLHRPMNTDPCYFTDVLSKDWVYYNQRIEEQSLKYYNMQDNTISNNQISSQSSSRDCPVIKPWIYGVTYNVNTESGLKALDYQNPKDCINSQNYLKVGTLNQQAMTLLPGLQCQGNEYMNSTMNWWNNQTKAKLIQSEKNRKMNH